MDLPTYFEAIESHLNEFIETSDEIAIFHEKESLDFHLDVYWIKPNEQRNFTMLMTNGISSIPLNIPINVPKKIFSPYIELCILLPKDWNFENDNWKKPEYFWAIKLLRELARYPHKNNTWFGFGHTIPNTEPIIGTGFMATILLKSKTLPEEFQKIKYGDKIIELYTLFPLYSEELEFDEKNGTNALLELFNKNSISDIINIDRKNVCRN
jgi:hypothetical protein